MGIMGLIASILLKNPPKNFEIVKGQNFVENFSTLSLSFKQAIKTKYFWLLYLQLSSFLNGLKQIGI